MFSWTKTSSFSWKVTLYVRTSPFFQGVIMTGIPAVETNIVDNFVYKLAILVQIETVLGDQKFEWSSGAL